MSFVERLSLRQLQPIKKIQKNRYNPDYKVYHIFPVDCHHGSLKFIGNFLNVKHISLVFGKNGLGRYYERRLFDVSEEDLESLAKYFIIFNSSRGSTNKWIPNFSGLISLRKLETFAIRKSKLTKNRKFFDLLLVLKNKKYLRSLDFSYCSLGEEAGESLEMFMNFNNSLESLELQGNFLGPKAFEGLANGLSQFTGSLKYLGSNPTNFYLVTISFFY